jgi:hypothetical protein
MEQPPLFDAVGTPRPRKRAAAGVRYVRHVPRWRTLCDLCIADIHRHGQGVARFPGAVRWRRIDGDGTTAICEQHKQECEESE